MENQNEILKKINSGEQELLQEAIKEIKENGDLSMAEILMDSLTEAGENQHLLISLLSDIKATDFRELLIKKLNEATDPIQKAHFIRIAWESSLDYSAYWELFLEHLINGEFIVSLEASTALENMFHQLTLSQRAELKKQITVNPLDEKKKFLAENIFSATDTEEEE